MVGTTRTATGAILSELQTAIEKHFGVLYDDWPPQLQQALRHALHQCYWRGVNDAHERLTGRPMSTVPPKPKRQR